MSKNSRTTNTIYNFTSSIGGQFITIIMQFLVRTVFIRTLGSSYLGINGLFSNILSMLSLAEFGVGSAILFKLYEPIAHDDARRITILMRFYKKVYQYIGIAVGVIGLCLIPFLPNLISDYDKLEALEINAVIIFVLYLLKSVFSYLFFAYKSAIIKANQKEYLINLISYVITFLSGVFQIGLLLTYPKFEIYVLISVFTVILQNIIVAVLADRMYPFINEKSGEQIDITEIKEIFKDCSALFLYKLNGVVLKATDNIILSIFLGLEMVGKYSNYYIFYTTINTLFNKVFNSVSHSLGNLHTTHDKEHEYEVFETVNFITVILGATAGIGIFVVADEFVDNWIGASWRLLQPFSLLMGLEIYTLANRIALSKYRTTMGLFQQAKFRPLVGMIINLVVSILLVKYWGICGVLVGTIIADWTTFMWFDPLIIHKYGFKDAKLVLKFYKKTMQYLLIAVFVGAMNLLICNNIFIGYGWMSVIIHGLICGITVPGVYIILNKNTPEGEYVRKLGLREMKKIKRKLRIE